MNYSPTVTDEIESLKASMRQLAIDLSSGTLNSLPPQSFDALSDTLAELMLTCHRIQRYTDEQRHFDAVVTFTSAIRDIQMCPELASIIVSQVLQLLTADFVALVMRDRTTGESVVAHTLGIGPFSAGQRIAPGRSLVGQVIATGKLYCSAEANPADTMASVHAAIGTPMTTQGQTIGLLWLARNLEFSESEIRLIQLLGDLSAIALHRTDTAATLLDYNTQLVDAKAQLQELDDLKAKFINDMSHELRTPITGLNMVLYLLERNGQEKYTQYLSNLREEVERLTSFTEGILDVTRLESKMNEAHIESLDFTALATQLVSIYHTRAERANVSWNFFGIDTPLMVNGDQNLLITAIGNLLTNAINYSLQGKVMIHIIHDRMRHCATLIVENNGIGVDSHELPHLFERFYRGNRVAESSIHGTGLGLAIVKQIVDFHHGHVGVDTTDDGIVRFILCIPLNSTDLN